jgi:hypothetical protein
MMAFVGFASVYANRGMTPLQALNAHVADPAQMNSEFRQHLHLCPHKAWRHCIFSWHIQVDATEAEPIGVCAVFTTGQALPMLLATVALSIAPILIEARKKLDPTEDEFDPVSFPLNVSVEDPAHSRVHAQHTDIPSRWLHVSLPATRQRRTPC